jgi:SAM-dependent MidA family methyltransferase
MGPLEAEIRRMIAVDGPIPVARYMELCLAHPLHGYYVTRDPLGARGDFTTAPEISQMFGELIGLWAAVTWRAMGAPPRVALVELGPGRGTLMADILNAAKIVPKFRTAVEVHLVEMSPALRRHQDKTLDRSGKRPAWHATLEELPEAPAIILANEFFDALPVYQAVKAPDGWHERMVGLDDNGKLAFALAPDPLGPAQSLLPPTLDAAPLGAMHEWRSGTPVHELGRRVAQFGGAALVIDYGHVQSGVGETLQAVRSHGFADPLVEPGEADLTAHVDFAALAEAGRGAGARVHGPLTQGEFLRRLGIEARAAALAANATPQQAILIDSAIARLTGAGRDNMGELFKVIALADPKLPALPAFDT